MKQRRKGFPRLSKLEELKQLMFIQRKVNAISREMESYRPRQVRKAWARL